MATKQCIQSLSSHPCWEGGKRPWFLKIIVSHDENTRKRQKLRHKTWNLSCLHVQILTHPRAVKWVTRDEHFCRLSRRKQRYKPWSCQHVKHQSLPSNFPIKLSCIRSDVRREITNYVAEVTFQCQKIHWKLCLLRETFRNAWINLSWDILFVALTEGYSLLEDWVSVAFQKYHCSQIVRSYSQCGFCSKDKKPGILPWSRFVSTIVGSRIIYYFSMVSLYQKETTMGFDEMHDFCNKKWYLYRCIKKGQKSRSLHHACLWCSSADWVAKNCNCQN